MVTHCDIINVSAGHWCDTYIYGSDCQIVQTTVTTHPGRQCTSELIALWQHCCDKELMTLY